MVRAFLAAAGILIAGPTTVEPAPETATELTGFSSPPLGQLVESMNQHSNNFMADMITTALGDSVSRGAELARGAVRLTRWFRRLTGASADVCLLDGSGLK